MQRTLMSSLETYFAPFRKNTIGIDTQIDTPFGKKPLIYADWIASGRLYDPIERHVTEVIGPMVGNTHSESSTTGRAMNKAYHMAHDVIKNHVNAGADDVIITAGFGMTAVVNKLQRMMGLRVPERSQDFSLGLPTRREEAACDEDCPVVFVTHMEHHSNHISWLETIADVIVIPPGANNVVEPNLLEAELSKYSDRKLKIGAFTAASNVSGILPDYRELARIMHRHGGFAFIDFAASAPYVHIDMHPEGDSEGSLDAVYFSPHKFLGGPGSSGVVVFNKSLYNNLVPDHPGGGTVNWTNRWNERSYVTDIEAREDGGTPGILQAIRAAMCIRLKDEMGVDKMAQRDKELLDKALGVIRSIDGIHILADGDDERIGVISFYTEGVHHNLMVRLLNDHFGIQVRGGCSCAGTYGHYLLDVTRIRSSTITEEIEHGDLTHKPGWVRLSLHPTMTDLELDTITNAIAETRDHAAEWSKDYTFDPASGEYYHRTWKEPVQNWLKWT
jgi:selenocysteine lyase/cysteine desulfurase